MRIAAVTGASGFVGRYVVRVLSEKDFRIRELAHSGSEVTEIVDLRDPTSVRGCLGETDLVIHLAARAGGVDFQGRVDPTVFLDNRAITDNVLEEASRSGVKRVFLASSAVVYRHTPSILSEVSDVITASDGPSPYAWSKINDEVVGRWFNTAYGIEVVIGRLANVYGPGGDASDDTGTVIHVLARRAIEADRAGDETFVVRGHPDSRRSFIHVTDAATAIVAVAISGDAGEIYNIDTGRSVSIAELASIVSSAIGNRARPVFPDKSRASPNYRACSAGRLAELGVEAVVDLETGIADYVNWLSTNL